MNSKLLGLQLDTTLILYIKQLTIIKKISKLVRKITEKFKILHWFRIKIIIDYEYYHNSVHAIPKVKHRAYLVKSLHIWRRGCHGLPGTTDRTPLHKLG